MGPSVSFANYRFDVETGRLWSLPQEIRLTPKAPRVTVQLIAVATGYHRWSQRFDRMPPGAGAGAGPGRGPCGARRALSLSARYDEAAQEFEEAIRLKPHIVRRLRLFRTNQLRAR